MSSNILDSFPYYSLILVIPCNSGDSILNSIKNEWLKGTSPSSLINQGKNNLKRGRGIRGWGFGGYEAGPRFSHPTF